MRRSRAFDAEAWRISGNDGGVNSWRASRHLMVNDLLAQGYLDGATRAEVLERLGAPDWKGSRDGEVFKYFLKPTIMDSVWLVIEFNEFGVVSSASVRIS